MVQEDTIMAPFYKINTDRYKKGKFFSLIMTSIHQKRQSESIGRDCPSKGRFICGNVIDNIAVGDFNPDFKKLLELPTTGYDEVY